jgi:hypothetical protein
MNIVDLQDKLEQINDDRYLNIIELLVSAVNDYPSAVLDTDDYLAEVKKLIAPHEMTPERLKELCDNTLSGMGFGENSIWIVESVTCLLNAFDIMRIHNITLGDVLKKIESLET